MAQATTTANQLPKGVSLPEWQTWYSQNVGKTILINGRPQTIGTGSGQASPEQVLSAYRNNAVSWGDYTPETGQTTAATGVDASGMPNYMAEFTGDQVAHNGDQTLYRYNPADGTTQAINQQTGQVIKTMPKGSFDAQIKAAVSSGIARQTAPEQVAQTQMAQIDPTGEAIRRQMGQSYLSNLGGGAAVPQPGALPQFKGQTSTAAPATSDIQSYLNAYKQIDPQGYQQRVALAGSESDYLKQVQQQAALGAQLDPGTVREVEQGVRSAQAARGNVYGTPQLVAETMARGQAGEQRLQQREQMLQSALGNQQSYLQSGVGIGDVANALYNQGYNRYIQGYQQQVANQAQTYGQQLNAWQAQQNARINAQNQALSYLSSGQTPYQAGSAYYDRAQAAAQQAASYGAPTYQPSALGQNYTGGGAGYYPQYGLEMGNQATNWYNSMINQNYQQGMLGQSGSRGGYNVGKGLGGAASGAATGAIAGSVVPGWGTAIGAIGGAIGGALGGFSG